MTLIQGLLTRDNILLEWLLLFSAGFFGGALNAIAGGGSFITFPALLLAGIPPISANATNTFASCSGYLSGAYALRGELKPHRKELLPILSISLVGGLLGAWLLLTTPENLFRKAIPWLLLFATLLFIFGGDIHRRLKTFSARHRHASTLGRWLTRLLLLGVALYGGFFNAGLGIIILSYLALSGHVQINAMNGLKLLISSAVSLIAIALFIHQEVIAWQQGLAVLLGTFAGGYASARLSQRLPEVYVRNFAILIGVGTTLYFFLTIYWTES